MNRLGDCRLVRALLSAAIVAGSVPFPSPSAGASTTAGITASLDQAREFIKTREYDNAIEILTDAIAASREDPAALREAYLLLIKTWVFLGAENEVRQQGRETARLNYEEAKKRIADCLGIRELRHTRPEPASEYPARMIALFAEVRSQIFGSFRVSELRPSDATVLLDGDTLRTMPGENALGDVDLTVGRHLVAVHAAGFTDLTEEIQIPAGSILERTYELIRPRSRTWYAAVTTGAVGVLAIAFFAGRGGGAPPVPPAEELPAAPEPPPR